MERDDVVVDDVEEWEGRWKEVTPTGRRVRNAAKPNFIFE